MREVKKSRRELLLGGFRGSATAAIAGSAWTGWVQESRTAPLALRPPGALPEERFAAACLKCGACVEACPYDVLGLADAGHGPIGTPTFEPRKKACEMCPEIPCVRKCPSGALDTKMQHIEDARMGVAVLDAASCLSMQGLRCEACYRACPLIGRAISLVYRHQERTGVHAYFEPTVNVDVCTGCGQCEHACVAEEPAIRVRPHGVARGRLGDHYQLPGKSAPEVAPAKERARPPEDYVPGRDYLNSGDLP